MGRTDNMWYRVAVVIISLSASCHAVLLGAGTGEGSCAAAPFRAPAGALKWPLGCPAGAECCSEYGYCRSQAEWAAGGFRDCNGVSNGRPLAAEAIDAENFAAAHGDTRGVGLINVPAGGNPAGPPAVAVAVSGAAGVGYAAAPVATVAGAGYGYAAAPAAVIGGGIGYAAAAAPAAVGGGYGYAGAVPAAVGAGYGYAAAAAATVAGAGYGYAAAPAGYANTGYVVSGY